MAMQTNEMSSSPTQPAEDTGKHRLIDKNEMAARLDMSPRTVLRHADAGLIPWGVKVGSLRRWDALEIDRFIAGGRKPPKWIGRQARRG